MTPFSKPGRAISGAVVLSGILIGGYVALGNAGLSLGVLDLLFTAVLLLLWLG
jgi:hypothetical protein